LIHFFKRHGPGKVGGSLDWEVEIVV